ncbi:unnamed protein product [Aphanomyces euteiches]|nr:hypothetical protein Ae201684P_003032 [Aphanomyces euteiches]
MRIWTALVLAATPVVTLRHQDSKQLGRQEESTLSRVLQSRNQGPNGATYGRNADFPSRRLSMREVHYGKNQGRMKKLGECVGGCFGKVGGAISGGAEALHPGRAPVVPGMSRWRQVKTAVKIGAAVGERRGQRAGSSWGIKKGGDMDLKSYVNKRKL